MREIHVDTEVEIRGSRINMKRDRVKHGTAFSHREYIDTCQAAAVVAMLGKHIVMVRQFRYAVNEHVIEIPAGKIDLGEAALETAQRELAEETGFQSKQWSRLGEILPSPGYTNERIHIFFADNIYPIEKQVKGDEVDILVLQYTPWLAYEMIKAGNITDAKTVAGLLMAKDKICK